MVMVITCNYCKWLFIPQIWSGFDRLTHSRFDDWTYQRYFITSSLVSFATLEKCAAEKGGPARTQQGPIKFSRQTSPQSTDGYLADATNSRWLLGNLSEWRTLKHIKKGKCWKIYMKYHEIPKIRHFYSFLSSRRWSFVSSGWKVVTRI